MFFLLDFCLYLFPGRILLRSGDVSDIIAYNKTEFELNFTLQQHCTSNQLQNFAALEKTVNL